MNRTHLLLATTALLALGALGVGRPRPLDTSHTHPSPGEPVSTPVLPTVSSRAGALTLEGKLSGGYLRSGPSEAFAVLTVRADRPPEERRLPVNLALVIDRSGSMRGQKLAEAKRAARLLIQRLQEGDRLVLVHYGTDVSVLPGERVSPQTREKMLAFVDAIEDEGSTNTSDALEAAATQLRSAAHDFRVSRVILLSDGVPTLGLTEDWQLKQRVAGYRQEGLTVSALGVGEDFNEQLMRGLAEQGGGFYGYIQDSERLAEILRRELDQATGTLARQVELRLETPPGVTGVEALGLEARTEGRARVLSLYDLAGGQEARVVVKLTLDLEAQDTPREVLTARLRYEDVRDAHPVETTLGLTARVTEDAEQVLAHLDRDVRADATRALGAQQMQGAAEQMKLGNREVALGMLSSARTLFRGSDSAQALAGEALDVEQIQAAYQNARDETSVRQETLKLHRKSLRNFGQENAY